jgi:hypothetical protein
VSLPVKRLCIAAREIAWLTGRAKTNGKLYVATVQRVRGFSQAGEEVVAYPAGGNAGGSRRSHRVQRRLRARAAYVSLHVNRAPSPRNLGILPRLGGRAAE